jgi:hypothetical protein
MPGDDADGATPVLRFDLIGDAGVETPPGRAQQAPVRGIVNQRVREPPRTGSLERHDQRRFAQPGKRRRLGG